MAYCYLNDDKVLQTEAHLHISDLGLQRGYGVFDYMPVYNKVIPWLDRYMNRLTHSTSSMGLDDGLDTADVRSKILDLVKESNLMNGGVKVLVTGGYSPDLSSVVGTVNTIITFTPMHIYAPEMYTSGVNVISYEYIREFPDVKTTNYATAMRLYKQMKYQNAVEILYYNEIISEASRSNIFFVKNGIIYSADKNILNGITRSVVCEIADVDLRDIPISELYSFDEAFMTSTVKRILPVTSVDGRKIGKGTVGPATLELMDSFQRALISEVGK